jgi:hypothetical protein
LGRRLRSAPFFCGQGAASSSVLSSPLGTSSALVDSERCSAASCRTSVMPCPAMCLSTRGILLAPGIFELERVQAASVANNSRAARDEPSAAVRLGPGALRSDWNCAGAAWRGSSLAPNHHTEMTLGLAGADRIPAPGSLSWEVRGTGSPAPPRLRGFSLRYVFLCRQGFPTLNSEAHASIMSSSFNCPGLACAMMHVGNRR